MMSSKSTGVIVLLVVNSLLFGRQATAAPAVTVGTASTTDGKDPTKGDQVFDSKNKLKRPEEATESPTTLPLPDVNVKNNFKYHGEVALYYSSAGILTAIIIYPYQEVLKMINDKTDSAIDPPSKEIFDLTKILFENGIEQDSSGGLIRVVEIYNTYTIDLNGTYPENMESRFKVSEYLDNTDGSPLANLLLLESSAYPGYYLRWYDDGTVDCEPQQTKIPSNDDFYWKSSLPAATGISPQMFPILLQTVSNLTLVFLDRTPHVVSGTTIVVQ